MSLFPWFRSRKRRQGRDSADAAERIERAEGRDDWPPLPPQPTTDGYLQREIERCWPLAKAQWSSFLLLSSPADDLVQPSIAQIDLGTRLVTLNSKLIREKNLLGCVEAMLAHEIGHHVRYPGTLAVQARLRILERAILPFDEYSLINLFTDFLINHHIGHGHLRDQLIAIYQAFADDAGFQKTKWKHDPAFLFYLVLYEILWELPPHTLTGKAGLKFDRHFRGNRAEASVFVPNLLAIGPNIFTMYLYFVSVVCRFLKPLAGSVPRMANPCRCGDHAPSPNDWGEALVPGAKELEAIRRALAEGWFDDTTAEELENAQDIDGRIATLPGFGTADASQVPQIMAAYYLQQAEMQLIKPPPQKRLGEATVPTTLDEWEIGDAVRDIDWLATLSLRGEMLGGAMPLKRQRIAEEQGHDVTLWQPRMEIYLDVSGSMPDPRRTRNAMTLAALILAIGAIRAGGSARAALYSWDTVRFWEWCRSEREIAGFLMHYIGAGTSYPFALLDKSRAECAGDQPMRVVITDSDFCCNYKNDSSAARILSDAVAVSPRFILLLHHPDPDFLPTFRGMGASVIEIGEFEDFPKTAAELAHALFPDSIHGPQSQSS